MAKNPDAARERRLRLAARSVGFGLIRSPKRGANTVDQQRYLLIDAEQDVVVLGGEPVPFSASLDQIESFLMDGASTRQRRRVSPPDRSESDDPRP
jgi:hypothetical protein